MPTANKFNYFLQRLNEMSYSADQFRIALSNTQPDGATDQTLLDIAEISYDNIAASTRDVSISSRELVNNTYQVRADNVNITASGGQSNEFRYLVLYNHTTSVLIAWYDYGSTIRLQNNQILRAVFSMNGQMIVIS